MGFVLKDLRCFRLLSLRTVHHLRKKASPMSRPWGGSLYRKGYLKASFLDTFRCHFFFGSHGLVKILGQNKFRERGTKLNNHGKVLHVCILYCRLWNKTKHLYVGPVLESFWKLSVLDVRNLHCRLCKKKSMCLDTVLKITIKPRCVNLVLKTLKIKKSFMCGPCVGNFLKILSRVSPRCKHCTVDSEKA